MAQKNRVYLSLCVVLLLNNNLSQAQTNIWIPSGLNESVSEFTKNSLGHIFALSNSSLFRSTDEGHSWIKVNLPTVILDKHLGIDGNNFLYIGTELEGIYRSTDNGQTWNQTSMTPNAVNKFLEISHNVLFATSFWGLYCSIDQGFSWITINEGLPTPAYCTNIIIGQDGSLFVGTQVGIYKSTDNGASWMKKASGLIGGISCLHFDTNNRLYAATTDGGVFLSTDAGISWVLSKRYGFADYVWSFCSTSHNQVFGLEINGVSMSTDGGQIWREVNNGLSGSISCVMTNSLQEVLAATSNGVFRRNQFLTSAPIPPKLLFPADSSSNISLNTSLMWQPDSTSNSYAIVIANDRNFNNQVFWTNTSTTLVQAERLSLGTTYYWHVMGSNVEGNSDWSNVWSFTTPYPPLAPPSLVSPANGSNEVALNPKLSWRSVPSLGYMIQISSDTGFASIVFEHQTNNDTIIAVSSLQPRTTYFWRVRTIRIDSTSVWSLLWKFSTYTGDTPPLDHFPLAIGNSWYIASMYMSTPQSYTLKRVEMDTVLSDGKTYSAIRNYTRPASDTLWTPQNWDYLRLDGSRLYSFPNSLIVDFDLTVGDSLPNGCIISDYRDSWLGRSSRILAISPNYDPEDGYDFWSYVDSMGYGVLHETSFYNYYPVYTIVARINGVEYGSVSPVAVHDKDFLSPPTRFFLYQNYPNPFNSTTNISFTISSKSFVSLKVFDLIGREITTIVSEELSAGTYLRLWNAMGMASGIYFYRFQAGSFIQTKKLVLLR